MIENLWNSQSESNVSFSRPSLLWVNSKRKWIVLKKTARDLKNDSVLLRKSDLYASARSDSGIRWPRRRRPWYIGQDDQSADHRCQKVVTKIGVCVPPTFSCWRSCSGKQPCVDVWGTDWDLSILKFSASRLNMRANTGSLRKFNSRLLTVPPGAFHFPTSLQKILPYVYTPFGRRNIVALNIILCKM